MGHTHEDIDQLFSKIAEEIRRAGCQSIPGICNNYYSVLISATFLFLSDLLQLIHRSSTPNPSTYQLSAVWDFKRWLEPVLGAVGGHSKYLVFRFTLGSTSRAEMHYKRFSAMPWEPSGDGIHLLSVCTLILILFVKSMLLGY